MIAGLRQAIGATAAMVVMILVFILGVGLLCLGGYEINAWLSRPVSNAQIHSDTNNTQNRETAQYQFTQDYNAIQTDVTNIRQDAANYYDASSDYALSLVKSDQHGCEADVAAYNTLASGTLTAPWKPAQYPDTYDATTTCAMPPKGH